MKKSEVQVLLQWLEAQKQAWDEDSQEYSRKSDLTQAKACEYAVIAFQKVIDHLTKN